MDPISSDLEFIDFKNASDEETKEIQDILKGPRSNVCVELPWETALKETCVETYSEIEETLNECDPSTTPKSNKGLGTVVGHALHFVAPQTPLSPPVAPLPPPQGVETFVTLPTTVGPYPNAPYIVSRTIPYLRAYPHMGVPLFACPLPATGDMSPYGQFVPVVPTPGGHEKFIGQIENESNQKSRVSAEKQFHRRKKKHTDYSGALELENIDSYHRETVLSDEIAQTSPVSSIVSSERPTSMPLVPLPPSTFAVAGGALPLHGYPPSIHTLPYTQMPGPQAPSPTMYYVPVFNHPYGGYISSPPSAPMVLPVNLRPEAEVNELAANMCFKSYDISDTCASEERLENVDSFVVESPESDINVQSNCESPSVKPCSESVDAPVAKSSGSEKEEITDSTSCSYQLSKSVSSSPDCIPQAAAVEDYFESQPPSEEIKEVVLDPSRCWADLFKKPCPEVNGIDRPTEHRHKNSSTLKNIANGKMYTVPASDSIH